MQYTLYTSYPYAGVMYLWLDWWWTPFRLPNNVNLISSGIVEVLIAMPCPQGMCFIFHLHMTHQLVFSLYTSNVYVPQTCMNFYQNNDFMTFSSSCISILSMYMIDEWNYQILRNQNLQNAIWMICFSLGLYKKAYAMNKHDFWVE